MRTDTRKAQNGFTLIELLVVISIIAMLLSILMPALNRARTMARTVVCQSNLRNWGMIWEMYTQDNNGNFIAAGNAHGNAGFGTTQGREFKRAWWVATQNYHQGAYDIFLCPEATDDYIAGEGDTADSTERSWPITDIAGDVIQNARGSYGINTFIHNPPDQFAGGAACHTGGRPKQWYWRRPDVRNAENVPVMGDSPRRGDWVEHTDQPPEYRGQPAYRDWGMGGFAIDRHDGRTTILFMDSSARTVPLKRLWSLRWHREFNLRNPYNPDFERRRPIRWPDWMRNFPD